MSQQQEALEFLWTPGESVRLALGSKKSMQHLVADYTVLLRVPSAGATELLFVRYLVGPSGIRFFVMRSEPDFVVTQFPTYRNTFGASWKPTGETAVYNRHRKFEKVGAVRYSIPRLSFDQLHYDIASLLHVPRYLLTDSEGGGPKRHRTYLSNGLLSSESWRPAGGLSDVVIKCQYDNETLRGLHATLPPIKYMVPASSGFRSIMTSELLLKGVEAPRVPAAVSQIAEVPVFFRHGSRNLNVKFSRLQLCLPEELTLAPADKNAAVGLIASARLLSAREISINEYERDPEFIHYERLKSLAPFWGKFHTPAGTKAVDRFRKDFESPVRSAWERLGLHGKMLLVSIFNNDIRSAKQELFGYCQAIRDLGLEAALPELLYPLFLRIDWSGTREMYEAMLDGVAAECHRLDEELRFRSCLHLRQLGVAPYAIFNMAFPTKESSVVGDKGSPEVSMLGLYLAASLLPSMKSQLNHGAQQTFLKDDAGLVRVRLTSESLGQISSRIQREAGEVLNSLSKDARTRWEERTAAIRSWTGQSK
jgi:hypothetical protein